MANANTAGELSLPQTRWLSTGLMHFVESLAQRQRAVAQRGDASERACGHEVRQKRQN